MEKKQRSSPLPSLVSSRPRSLPSTAVCMAGLFSLTGCESHETGGHQGPGPPRQHAPPQSAAHSVPRPPHPRPSRTMSCLPSIRLSLSNTLLLFSLPSIGPLILSHLHSFFFLFAAWLSYVLFVFFPSATHQFSPTGR